MNLWDVNEGSNTRGAALGRFRGAPAEIIAEITAGIVRERGDDLGFQHDLIREAVRQCPRQAISIVDD